MIFKTFPLVIEKLLSKVCMSLWFVCMKENFTLSISKNFIYIFSVPLKNIRILSRRQFIFGTRIRLIYLAALYEKKVSFAKF